MNYIKLCASYLCLLRHYHRVQTSSGAHPVS